jgi:hypothetical protein
MHYKKKFVNGFAAILKAAILTPQLNTDLW